MIFKDLKEDFQSKMFSTRKSASDDSESEEEQEIVLLTGRRAGTKILYPKSSAKKISYQLSEHQQILMQEIEEMWEESVSFGQVQSHFLQILNEEKTRIVREVRDQVEREKIVPASRNPFYSVDPRSRTTQEELPLIQLQEEEKIIEPQPLPKTESLPKMESPVEKQTEEENSSNVENTIETLPPVEEKKKRLIRRRDVSTE